MMKLCLNNSILQARHKRRPAGCLFPFLILFFCYARNGDTLKRRNRNRPGNAAHLRNVLFGPGPVVGSAFNTILWLCLSFALRSRPGGRRNGEPTGLHFTKGLPAARLRRQKRINCRMATRAWHEKKVCFDIMPTR